MYSQCDDPASAVVGLGLARPRRQYQRIQKRSIIHELGPVARKLHLSAVVFLILVCVAIILLTIGLGFGIRLLYHRKRKRRRPDSMRSREGINVACISKPMPQMPQGAVRGGRQRWNQTGHRFLSSEETMVEKRHDQQRKGSQSSSSSGTTYADDTYAGKPRGGLMLADAVKDLERSDQKEGLGDTSYDDDDLFDDYYGSYRDSTASCLQAQGVHPPFANSTNHDSTYSIGGLVDMYANSPLSSHSHGTPVSPSVRQTRRFSGDLLVENGSGQKQPAPPRSPSPAPVKQYPIAESCAAPSFRTPYATPEADPYARSRQPIHRHHHQRHHHQLRHDYSPYPVFGHSTTHPVSHLPAAPAAPPPKPPFPPLQASRSRHVLPKAYPPPPSAAPPQPPPRPLIHTTIPARLPPPPQTHRSAARPRRTIRGFSLYGEIMRMGR